MVLTSVVSEVISRVPYAPSAVVDRSELKVKVIAVAGRSKTEFPTSASIEVVPCWLMVREPQV